MRALTVRQPWASLIARGADGRPGGLEKDVENRTWRGPAVGERIAIHAGSAIDREALHALAQLYPWLADAVMEDVGRIVCTVVVEGYCDGITEYDWHQDGFIGWMLADSRPVRTPPMRGMLGLWRVPDDHANLVSDGKP